LELGLVVGASDDVAETDMILFVVKYTTFVIPTILD
jgi:hypothetical protein